MQTANCISSHSQSLDLQKICELHFDVMQLTLMSLSGVSFARLALFSCWNTAAREINAIISKHIYLYIIASIITLNLIL